MSVEMDLKFAASHAKEAAERKRAEGCLDCADEHLQLAAWLEELQAYKDTGVSAQELQDVVDLFTEATVSEVDVPKELKRWMERCTWHARKCVELGEKLSSTVEEANFFYKNYETQVSERIRLERKLRRTEKLVLAMKTDLLLAASGHCCGICARKTECADVAQVSCCSAFRYYKTEEE